MLERANKSADVWASDERCAVQVEEVKAQPSAFWPPVTGGHAFCSQR
jgi:hypothetical protein